MKDWNTLLDDLETVQLDVVTKGITTPAMIDRICIVLGLTIKNMQEMDRAMRRAIVGETKDTGESQ